MEKMPFNPQRHHRRSIRLKGYDYAQPGGYFVTFCVREHACELGQIIDGKMTLSDTGRIVHDFWIQIPVHFPNVSVDMFVVMPNHVHAILMIEGRGGVTPPLRPTLGQIVAYYKHQTTAQINQLDDNAGVPFWQRGYYERIIRNERDLQAIRKYILENPLKWELDQENPAL